MASSRNLLIPFLCAVGSNAIRSALKQSMTTSSASTSGSSFANFKLRYGRKYQDDSEEHRMREDVFQNRLLEIAEHNARGLSWKMGVNHLTDRTLEELDVLNGHKPSMRPASAATDSLLEVEGEETACVSHNNSCTESSCCSGFTCGVNGICVPTKTALSFGSFDWSDELSTAHSVLEQGSCGSCWAVAATAALNLHAEIVSGKKFKKVLSPQSILACSPNKLECGGQGGCKGATAEVAYDWLKSMGARGGVQTIDIQPYTAQDGMCSSLKSFLRTAPAPAVGIGGWKKIKENDAAEMMNALVTVGPLVTSIAANGMHGYSSGVIDGCKNNVVNHAVVLMGYGKDDEFEMNYWNIRNSWGNGWGENGFFRLKRAARGSKEPCGWDDKPEKGVVCKDKEHGKYPTRQWVCGECGFLTDTAYPIGTWVPQELINTMPTEMETDEEDMASVDDANAGEIVQDNSWCKTRCQHFGMKQLSEIFEGADFGDDPTVCAGKCDEVIPPALVEAD